MTGFKIKEQKIIKNAEKGFALFLLLIPTVLVILPLLLLLSGSLMDTYELSG